MPKRRLTYFALAMTVLIATPLAVAATDRFADVPTSNVHHDDITWLADSGITRGCNPPANTNYCPDEAVSRDQMASFIRRLAQGKVVNAATAESAVTAESAGDADTLDGLDSSDFLAQDRSWSVSMPVESAFWFEGGSVEYHVAGGGSSLTNGLTLDDAGFGRFHHGFTLPPAYQAGGDVNIRMGWASETTNPGSCGFVVEVNSVDVHRDGSQVIRPEVTWENPVNDFFSDRTVLDAPDSPGPGNGFNIVVQGTYFTIEGAELQPGDQISLAINRDQDETGDTCTERLIIVGLTAGPA